MTLTPGKTLTNQELSDYFKCSTNAGMRRSHVSNTLVIVSSHVKSIYQDRWENNILYYTGMGQLGDQSLSFQQNKTLNESLTNGITVHLFESFIKNEYIYLGEVELASKPFQEDQRDANNNLRKVWVFPVQLKNTNTAIDSLIINKDYESKEKKSNKESILDLIMNAKATGREKVGYRFTRTKSYNRSMSIVSLAKRLANGVCQLCDQTAPFYDKAKKEPYLETHHIIHLAKGGMDTMNNTIALCPNCHKKMHVLDDPKDVIFLQKRNKEMIAKIELLEAQ
jgi:5-methylcytosine-specific restriction enzyme A